MCGDYIVRIWIDTNESLALFSDLQIKIVLTGYHRLIHDSDIHITSSYNFGNSSFSAVNMPLESARMIASWVSQKAAIFYDNKWEPQLKYKTNTLHLLTGRGKQFQIVPK